jgi:putative ABC transport system permease protein
MNTYLITALRNLKRNKFFTMINLVCMIIGLTCSSLLFLYVKKEMQSDQFFPQYENTFLITSDWGNSLAINHARLLKKSLPEIEQITCYHRTWSYQELINYNQTDFELKDAIYADSAFFNVFQYKALYGDLTTALMQPYTMVLTRPEAQKIFGNGNPVGKIIRLKTSTFDIHDYSITAVLDDIPNNCSFHFNAVASLAGLMKIDRYKQNAEHWGTCNYTTFARLAKGADIEQMNEKAKTAFLNGSPEWVHDIVPFKFIPLDGLHFYASDTDGVFVPNRLFTVNLLGAIGMLILLVAGINYFNLNRAQVDENRKQWSIRRTVGATRKQIIFHSLTTTSVIFAIAFTVSLLLIFLILPAFNSYTHSRFTFTGLFSSSNLLLIISLVATVLLFFGLIPAIITSNQPVVGTLKKVNPVQVQKRQFGQMVFQFGISMVLIIGAIFIYKQNQFMLNHDDGFRKKNIVYLKMNSEAKEKSSYLEQEYEKMPGVSAVSYGSDLMGDFSENWGRTLYCDKEDKEINVNVLNVSCDFPELFGLQVLEGNGFNESSPGRNDILVNQAVGRNFEIEKVIGASLSNDRKNNNVVGVIKDINQKSLHEKIKPLILRCVEDNRAIMFVRFDNLSMVQMDRTLDKFKTIWQEVSPDYPFNYEFLDSHYKAIYEKELKLMNLIVAATGLSIILSALGLIGLAYFMISKRKKEIGVRKVNGAKVVEILLLLHADFIKWILLAFILAAPAAWYAIQKWLENFAYKTELSWWVFALGGFLTLLMALLTVFIQSYKAAIRNPVESLKYE